MSLTANMKNICEHSRASIRNWAVYGLLLPSVPTREVWNQYWHQMVHQSRCLQNPSPDIIMFNRRRSINNGYCLWVIVKRSVRRNGIRMNVPKCFFICYLIACYFRINRGIIKPTPTMSSWLSARFQTPIINQCWL